MLSKLSATLRIAIFSLIASAAIFLILSSAWQESAVINENININSGRQCLTTLNCEGIANTSPLTGILSSLPLLIKNADTQSPELNLNLARIIPIILAFILILLTYVFSKELIGRWWALLPVFFLAFSPTLLSKGHYVIADIGTTLGIFIALTAFLKFLLNKNTRNLILAGLSLGLAQLFNFSAVFLIPYCILLMIIFYFTRVMEDWPLTNSTERRKRFIAKAFRYCRHLIFIFIIAAILIYLFTLLFTWQSPYPEKTFLGLNPHLLLKPIEYYFNGISVYLQSLNSPTYIFENIYDSAPWYYLPAVFTLKEPLPLVLAVIAALLIGFWKFIKNLASTLFKRSGKTLEYFSTHFPEFAMILLIIAYAAVGNKKILPILPFILILTSESIKNWFNLENLNKARNFIIKLTILANELAGISVKTILLILALTLYLSSALIAYPHFTSYFNMAAGGSMKGYRYLVDENYDLGQGLNQLSQWIKSNLPPEEKIAVDYYGSGDLQYYLGNRAEPWLSAEGTPTTDNINWLAISATNLQMAKAKIIGAYLRKPEDEYQWLENPHEPYAHAGTIFIYKLNPSR
ncbi:MAG: hypothetical protein A3I24_00415 [Candidatus Harrisonbacteria bacterium RIFCSPLOWO2_02_FULL_41_13b]|uniref:Glycosyltransferase RgtA/B/C/D-like domain-containing protein n=1 Tax=Candidatus Harrisonbacteria bacterium RIFCSPLOWO2_02_FULL_41_13b TaxID=1798409 RepID=A0A1G1ZS49_9BACT|nr:MAG: hypothetical protein A3I24_00415 [Candidatus Harrisonbacteria bacterium RIFCSPLOWO2_02_FULL_41_13b]